MSDTGNVEVRDDNIRKGGDEEEYVKLLLEAINPPKEGEIVKGVVVKVTPQEVYVDIGSKSEGVASRLEFKDPDIKPGQVVHVYVESIDGKDGRTIVSKHKADFLIAWDRIKEAYQSNETVEAKVLRQVKGGLIVDVFGVDAFLPGSQIDIKKVKSIPSFVGKTIPVKVIKLNRARKNIVVSRKEVLEEELEKTRQKFMELKPGDVIEGVVKNLTDFGAFVDIGGVDGLIHISDLSWQKVEHPSQVVKPGDHVKVKILEVDPQTMKLSLSLKHLQPHPWEKIAKKYPIGSKVTGIVRKIVDYGAFVEIEPGVEGLVHISEMVWGRPPHHPSEILSEGDRVEVVVLNIDFEKQRISLGMKQAKPDPWSLIEEKYPVGSTVKGTVKDFGNFGAYIEIEDGIEGFLHVADISWTHRISSPQEALRKGQRLRLKVLNIDKRNRFLELGLKQLRPNPWDEIARRIPPGTHIKATILEVGDRGVTVEVDKGLEGFVPQSHLHKRGNPLDNYKEGEELNLQVMRVEAQRKRILLSEREYYRSKEMEEIARYRPEPVRVNLGEVLRAELEKLEELKMGEEVEGGEKEES
jgi:small subunit ribosomal protein S1